MKLKIKYLTLLFTGVLFYSNSYSQESGHWESIFGDGEMCPYLVPDRDLGTAWQEIGYDDSEWEIGEAGFGFGDDDDVTILPKGTQSVYIRIAFDVDNISDITDLYLDMDYDAGFVAYINGTQVARENVQDPISWNMELIDYYEAIMYTGVNPYRYKLGEFISSVLEPGKNVLAVEVHSYRAGANDFSANVFLHAKISGSDSIYGPVPEWFGDTASFSEFNLPLMHINTNGQKIPDEPRIVADMGLVFNGEGAINAIDDPWNEYNGFISIERRGESSKEFAKKSFSIELQNADGSNNNVSVLGLPVENDFVLYGPFSDRTLVKNVLTYELFSRTGRWAPRTRFIELILNGDYEGVYVFTEKLKRDENRVDIDKLTSEDVSPIEISGGYILRRDKTGKLSDEEWWRSPVNQPYHNQMWYEYYDPEYAGLTPDQASYIRDWMEDFDVVMSSPSFSDPEYGYRKYIKTRSFIDMMFLNEISKGIDNYLFSNYFHKENDADGGQLVAGPPWDYNLGYGNLDYGDSWGAKESYGWCYPQGGRIYWFERLMEDGHYMNKTYCRWTEHREGIYSDENIMAIIDSCVQVLGDAADRNFVRFPTLGNYVWPSIEPYPETFAGEIDKLKTWLIARLAWMDSQWLNMGTCNPQPPTDITLSNNMIPENESSGTTIGTLNTVDPDSDSFTYSLVSGDGDTDNAKFSIYRQWLLSKMVFDYETQNTFSIRISSRDENHESIEKVFEVHVSNAVSAANRVAEDISFVLYPNPSSDHIQISSTAMGNHTVTIQLLDLSGKVLNRYEGQLEEINPILSDDSRGLEKGAYLVRIDVAGTSVTKKFIKL
ncbi:MAG: T9SS type A sorting domain-containing protein [Bacteroidetes bacterium]|nr:T9SS type A sorting domain-containing protein [Bacteroidota bacterium]